MATTKTGKNTTTKKTNPVTKKPATTTKTAAKTATKKAVKAEPKIAPKPAPKPAPTPATKKAAKTAPVQFSHETIAREAYFLWQSRGGCEMENWLEAERKVLSRGGAR